mmetsp:Transcript_16947/g.43277  ORF Transcript_16947/g.43277 Transcript_16947/m.43277 type:complete len:477 (+) Transcript_16947:83-1513(+)|eukprot:CAMPEP_0177682176 /NCGR_PEP_ID=MMETSP0447-20121125/31116_1 /TAXON_ID=0 /ORGANISM="Stygamoeba regulata, Strain BSH-02190019" /LENGTH=476 /DNA_ID=CAMNT_0019191655 /DNA_START=85 /DNA_END=1515 /DNA_ORIENTATION=+
MSTNAMDTSSDCNTPSLSNSSSSSAPPTLSRSSSLSSSASHGDRFIPLRSTLDKDISHYNLMQSKENTDNMGTEAGEDPHGDYRSSLAESLLGRVPESAKILAFKAKAPTPEEGHTNRMRVLYSQNRAQSKPQARVQSTRHIPSVPEKVLDAPAMVDDYYLNLLDWSASNVLAVALENTVYLWNASTGSIGELMHTPEDQIVTSVSFLDNGSHLAIGTSDSTVQLWDVAAGSQARSLRGHGARVSALSWNKHILSSAGRDTSIVNHDVRIKEHIVSSFQGHTQEVCGLKWDPSGTHLASGANDNTLCVWDHRSLATRSVTDPLYRMSEHTAAVKAVAWCPWQSGLLASGGGTADRKIRFWNTKTGSCLNTVDTNSQVCSILWSKNHRELVSSHGFSRNQLTVWKYPSLTRSADLIGHSSRVLHMAMSPDGQTVVSAGDETLRFWKVFENTKSRAKKSVALPTNSSRRSLKQRVNIR